MSHVFSQSCIIIYSKNTDRNQHEIQNTQITRTSSPPLSMYNFVYSYYARVEKKVLAELTECLMKLKHKTANEVTIILFRLKGFLSNLNRRSGNLTRDSLNQTFFFPRVSPDQIELR